MDTPQELAWAGAFGVEYTNRHADNYRVASNIALFAKLRIDISSAIELGANLGFNLIALRHLYPQAELWGVDINETACSKLAQVANAVRASVLEWEPERQWDLAFTKGLLIHIPPDKLSKVYDVLYRSSSRYIFIAEYYNPTPVSVPYRGHNNLLFKRDFAGDILKRYKDLQLIDYGFVYHRDPFPQDDVNWFLMEKH